MSVSIKSKANGDKSPASLGFEAKLWLTADKLRNNMDAAEYKHVVLGLIFLKYISDSFEEMRAKLMSGKGDYKGADPEDADEYKAENVFWVPKEARWSHLQASAKQPTIGKVVDDAMVALERDNPRLKGVLPKDYARPGLDKNRLGELIDVIGTIGLGDKENRSMDILGRVYEYFLTMFASAEGKNGGQFYTPNCVVGLLVGMLSPYKGRIYDPCCGSGGMFVQSEKFVEAHGGRVGDISIYGQESNATTRRLAIMNLAIRGIEADFGPEQADIQEFNPHIQTLLDIHAEISKATRESLRDVCTIIWKEPANDTDRRELVGRITRRRMAAHLDSAIDGKPLRAWEQFIFPPAADSLLTGDLLKESSSQSSEVTTYRMILTPSCDLARGGKVTHVLTARSEDIKTFFKAAGCESFTADKLKKSLPEKLRPDQVGGRIALPALPSIFPAMTINLKSLELIPLDQISLSKDVAKTHFRVASVDSPFREKMAWAYIQVAGRPGVPDLDVGKFAEELSAYA